MIFANNNAQTEKKEASGLYRVWLFAYDDWRPLSCSDLPLEAVALEEAETETFSCAEATRYVKSFNQIVLRSSSQDGKRVWAVALPVAVFYHGEPSRGQNLLPAP